MVAIACVALGARTIRTTTSSNSPQSRTTSVAHSVAHPSCTTTSSHGRAQSYLLRTTLHPCPTLPSYPPSSRWHLPSFPPSSADTETSAELPKGPVTPPDFNHLNPRRVATANSGTKSILLHTIFTASNTNTQTIIYLWCP